MQFSSLVKVQKHHRKVLQRGSTEETEKKYYQKRRPATGFKHIHLPHDNAPAHTSANSYGVFEERKSNCFTSPTVFPRPCLKGM